MKKHFIFLSTFVALLLSATLLTACGEDVQELADNGDNGETVTETTTGENCTLFSTGDDGTRTAIDTNCKFYWSEGDQIYVNTDGANYKKTSSSTLSSDKRTADFVLEGVLTHSPCSVMYIGNGTTEATAAASVLKVKIDAKQTQSAWGDSAHIGRAGDCGVAEATRDKTTGKYSFNLKHKASYLVFQPYRPTGNANPDWKLMKIEIIANGTNLAGTYDFGTGELVGTGSSNTIEFNCGTEGFDLSHTDALTTKSCFAVIQPGTHKLTIRYTVKVTKKPGILYFDADSINNEDEIWVIDKPITIAKQYEANYVTTIRHCLYPPIKYKPYYNWDAPIDKPYDGATSSYYNSSVQAPNQASRSCKDMPNANEIYWYIENGDPRWDETTPWSIDGGLNEYRTGCWIMKKDAILAAGRTFDPNVGKNGLDMRSSWGQTSCKTETYLIGGKPANTTDYFFLPALGRREASGSPIPHNVFPIGELGSIGSYWSRSPQPGSRYYAYYLWFCVTQIDLYIIHRTNACVVAPSWFQ